MKAARKRYAGSGNGRQSSGRSEPDPRDYEPIERKITRLVQDEDYMNWERSCNGERNPHAYESTSDRITRLLDEDKQRRYWENDTR